MSEEIFSLNCLVLGDPPDRIFSVKIASSENVSFLGDAIKEEKMYAWPQANQLVLYRTSEKVACWDDNGKGDDGLMQALREGGHSKLFPRDMLSTIFNYPLVAHAIHILVEPPSTSSSVPQAILSLNCLVLGDPPQRIFSVKIASSDNVSFLREAIKEKKQYKRPADQLVLCRTSLPNDGELENKLKSLDFNKLKPTSILAKIFAEPPVIEHLHIVVLSPPECRLSASAVDSTLIMSPCRSARKGWYLRRRIDGDE
ncbi:hypothetical protein EDC04DRAFT_3107243 [Pisolithus marmoratus]|nr:hypothetical protein EDC04DRAFT_3107243 [Pisolithus marmoratus]